MSDCLTQVAASGAVGPSADAQDGKRVAVAAESAVLNAVDDTFQNSAQKAAERITDASLGPSTATVGLQAGVGHR